MAKNVVIKLNKAGVRELLKSEWAAQQCKAQADIIKGRAGEGFVVQKRNYPERSGYAVKAETREAKNRNYRDNTLLKAMGGV